jgi:predicted TIM-barrel fold metal-dependent hydrolase
VKSDSVTGDRYTIISADCHAGADVLDYKPYLEKKWYEEFGAWAADYHDPWEGVEQGPVGTRVGVASFSHDTNWDSGKRLTQLEADGVAAEVIFPNTSPPFFPSGSVTAPPPLTREDFIRRFAGLQAHNRWLVDFCNEAPGRRAGIGQIFLNDVEMACQEIRWMKESGLTGGVLVPGVPPGSGLPYLYASDYEPIWALCAELDVPLNHHVGATTRPIDPTPGPVGALASIFESSWFSHRALMHMVFAGVFERYPNLRMAITESGTQWVPPLFQAADELHRVSHVEGTAYERVVGKAIAELPMTPSQYFARNCSVGASFMYPSEANLRYAIGVDNLMWGSDYPHSEGTFPHTVEALRATFSETPESELRRILGGNAARFYGFDLEELAPIAERIGPRISDVSTPLPRDEWPHVPSESRCAVFIPDMVSPQA